MPARAAAALHVRVTAADQHQRHHQHHHSCHLPAVVGGWHSWANNCGSWQLVVDFCTLAVCPAAAWEALILRACAGDAHIMLRYLCMWCPQWHQAAATALLAVQVCVQLLTQQPAQHHSICKRWHATFSQGSACSVPLHNHHRMFRASPACESGQLVLGQCGPQQCSSGISIAMFLCQAGVHVCTLVSVSSD